MIAVLELLQAQADRLQATVNRRMREWDRYRSALEQIAEDEHATDETRAVAKRALEELS